MEPERVSELESSLDRRRAVRYSTSYLRIFSPIPGTIVDLSRDGICFEVLTDLEPGVEYSVRLRHRARIWTLRIEVKWCRPQTVVSSSNGRSLQIYRVGGRLSDELPEPALALLVDG